VLLDFGKVVVHIKTVQLVVYHLLEHLFLALAVLAVAVEAEEVVMLTVVLAAAELVVGLGLMESVALEMDMALEAME
jgi:hypothetical protein